MTNRGLRHARVAVQIAGCLAALAVGSLRGQSAPPAPWRLGVFFWHSSPNDVEALQGIRSALSAHGRPHDLIVVNAKADRAEALRLLDRFREDRVDLVFAMGTEAALLAKERIRDLPVVFTAVTNPVESGVVASWEGSQSNLAGNSNWIAPETVMHVFQLAVPKLARLGMLRCDKSGVVSAAELRAMRDFLARPGAPAIELLEVVVPDASGIPAAVDRLVRADVQAIWIPIDFEIYQNMSAVLAALGPRGIPLVSSSLRGTNAGAVAGILVDYGILGQRAVVLAVEILERARRPGTIPVGTMRGYQVVVDLAAARTLGYELPLSLLVVADVIHERMEVVPGGEPQRK